MSKQVIIKWNPIKIWPFPIKSDSLRCYLPLRIISMQKKNNKKKDTSSRRYWWSKNPAIWLDERRNWSNQTKSGRLISLMTNSMQRNKDIDWLFLLISMAKEPCSRLDKSTTGHTQLKVELLSFLILSFLRFFNHLF